MTPRTKRPFRLSSLALLLFSLFLFFSPHPLHPRRPYHPHTYVHAHASPPAASISVASSAASSSSPSSQTPIRTSRSLHALSRNEDDPTAVPYRHSLLPSLDVRSLKHNIPDTPLDKDVIVVSPSGTVFAIDKKEGVVRWTFQPEDSLPNGKSMFYFSRNTPGPFGHSQDEEDTRLREEEFASGRSWSAFASSEETFESEEEDDEGNHDGNEDDRVPFLVPTTEGELLQYSSRHKRLVRTGTFIQDVASSTPIFTNDGDMWLGSKNIHVWALDPTGHPLYHWNSSLSLPFDCPPGSPCPSLPHLPDGTLLISRVDYSLFSLDPQTLIPKWTMLFNQYIGFDFQTFKPHREAGTRAGQTRGGIGTPEVYATADGIVIGFDHAHKTIRWRLDLQQKIVHAFDIVRSKFVHSLTEEKDRNIWTLGFSGRQFPSISLFLPTLISSHIPDELQQAKKNLLSHLGSMFISQINGQLFALPSIPTLPPQVASLDSSFIIPKDSGSSGAVIVPQTQGSELPVWIFKMDQVDDDDDNGVEDDDDNKKVSERIFVPEWWPNQWSQSRSKKPQLELPEPPKGSESAVSTNVISGQTRPGKGIFDDLMGTPSNDQTGPFESYPPIFHFYKDSSAQCHPHSPLFPACLLGLHFLPTSMIGGNTDPGDLFISTAILHLLHPPARILEIGDGSTTISDHLNDRQNFEYIHVPSSSLGSQYNWSLILSNYLPVCTQENLSPGEDCPWTVESIIELQNEQIEEERRRTEYNQQFNLFSAIIGSIFASFLFFMMHISRIKDHFVTFFNKLRGIEPSPKPQEPPKLAFPFADLILPSKSRSLDSLMIDRPQPPPSVDFLRSKSPLPTNSSSSSSSSSSSPVGRPDSISIVALDLQQPARSDQKEGGEEQPKPEQKEEEKNKQEEETKKEEQLEERKEPEEEEKVERMTKTRQSSVEVLKIGRLEISRKVLGYGSSGTIVYEGRLGHRRVAVKRMLADFYKIADKEVELLLKSDEHPNVVSYFTHEEDGQFIYLALTFCSMTLETFVELKTLGSKSHSSSSFPVAGRHGLKDKRLNESSPLPLEEDFALKQMISDLPEPSVDVMNGIGSLPMVKAVIKDVLQGVSHLHQLNIVHRDLKPQNVLIDPNGRARISDMGLAKRLDGHSMSFSSNVKGSWGWQAPEVLMGKRGSDRVDLFSIGCLAFYLLTGGLHPFGEALERELNIRDYRIVGLDRHSRRSKKPQSPSSSSSSSSSSRPIRVIGSGPAKPRSREETVNVWTRGGLRDQLEKKKEEAERAVEKEKEEDKTMAEITPEAEDLIRSLIHKEPQLRPSAQEALFHPFFWGARECLTFLRDASDRLEIEQPDKPIVLDFEARFATVCGGAQNNWFRDIIDDPLKKELSAGRFRKYNGQTLRDLLRLVRNKAHHFRDLPDDVRELFQNDLPDGFLRYFTMRFPRLVIETYCTIRKFCRHEATFGGYFGEDSLPTKTSTSSSSSSSS